MYKFNEEEIEHLNKAERDYDIQLYLAILHERNIVEFQIFEVLKMIRDTSFNDEDFGKNVKLFIKNK